MGFDTPNALIVPDAEIDGVVSDYALLSGMLAQDSYTSIVGAQLTSEDYCVAVRQHSRQ